MRARIEGGTSLAMFKRGDVGLERFAEPARFSACEGAWDLPLPVLCLFHFFFVFLIFCFVCVQKEPIPPLLLHLPATVCEKL